MICIITGEKTKTNCKNLFPMSRTGRKYIKCYQRHVRKKQNKKLTFKQAVSVVRRY